uniref:U1 small nuclear ribonucleoprotein 70 kDa n=8 Tax=Catarrhini TaxID=9526 RepID=A0A2I3RCM6_PANTR
MTQFLPPNLLALFAPRDPIPYLPPLEKLPHEKHHNQPYCGIAPYIREFEDPRDAPPPTRAETREERMERKRREKIERRQQEVETELKMWDPHNDPNAQGDAFKTLFVARVNYDTTESKLRREFEVYGPIKRIHMVYSKRSGKPRGYAFIEYEHDRERDKERERRRSRSRDRRRRSRSRDKEERRRSRERSKDKDRDRKRRSSRSRERARRERERKEELRGGGGDMAEPSEAGDAPPDDGPPGELGPDGPDGPEEKGRDRDRERRRSHRSERERRRDRDRDRDRDREHKRGERGSERGRDEARGGGGGQDNGLEGLGNDSRDMYMESEGGDGYLAPENGYLMEAAPE